MSPSLNPPLRIAPARAIPTHYCGIKMRSRLEARWAVYMDVCQYRWHYEMQGYLVGNGTYLPDFYVRDWCLNGIRREIWAEAKGSNQALYEDLPRLMEATKRTGLPEAPWSKKPPPPPASGCFWPRLLLLTDIPRDVRDGGGCIHTYPLIPTLCVTSNDQVYLIHLSPVGFDMIPDELIHPPIPWRDIRPEDLEVRMHEADKFHGLAMLTARNARFEHGNNPRIQEISKRLDGPPPDWKG